MDWITDTQRLISITQTCLREELPYISLVFLYINKNKETSSVKKDTLELGTQVRQISKEKVLELIETNNKEKYALRDTFLFHIPIEPESISLFHEDTYKNYWTSCPLGKDIDLAPTIFIFHPTNTIYFIYYEEEDKPLKSSLKKNSGIGKLTKKVRWGKHRHTRKETLL